MKPSPRPMLTFDVGGPLGFCRTVVVGYKIKTSVLQNPLRNSTKSSRMVICGSKTLFSEGQ